MSQGVTIPYDAELPYVLSVDQAASHLTTAATLTKVPPDRGLAGSGKALVLVDNELLEISAFTAHYLTISTTGMYGTKVVTHLATAHVYEVVSLRKTETGLFVGYIGTDGTIAYKRIDVAGEVITELPPTGDDNTFLGMFDGELQFLPLMLNDVAVAHLTDSTTGVVSVTSPPTLIAVRTDTIANAVADIIKNLATLNAHINAIATAVHGAPVIVNDD